MFALTADAGYRAHGDLLPASDSVLLDSFDKVMFGPDVDSNRGWRTSDMFVRKWEGPIKIELRGDAMLAEHRVKLMELLGLHIETLSSLTGLEIGLVSRQAGSGNFIIHFVLSPSMPKELRARNLQLGLTESRGSSLGCYVQREWDRTLTMQRAYIVIPVESGFEYVTYCLLEEMAQAMGPSNDASAYQGSSLFSNYLNPEFSINDMVLVRALYDDAITAGMSRDSALQKAEFVIPSLTGKLRSNGVEALWQK